MDPRTEALIIQLQNEIEILKGQVEKITYELNLKTDKHGIINQINISPENIRISADKITINNETMVEQTAKSPFRI